MEVSFNGSYFILEGHVELQKYRYVYFVISFIVYMLIICSNVFVISLIYANKSLHEPMYVFIAALFLNSVFGTTALYPKLLSDFLSEQQIISYQACMLQAFLIYTYAASEFTLLSAMAYDRYVSICKPLQYAILVKMSTVKKILFFSWFVPSCEIGVGMILTHKLKLCKFKLNRIYCDNYSIVKLSCGDTSVNNLYGLFILIVAILPSVIYIIYSYIRILAVCLNNSKDFKRKALQTCLPHLLIFISVSVNSCFEVINNRLETNIPQFIRILLSLENMVIPPVFNPIIYGLKLKEILNTIKKLFWKKKPQASF